MNSKHRFVLDLDDDELREATLYAWFKHMGGSRPVHALLKFAAFGYLKKQPIPAALRGELEKRYDEELADAEAVRLLALEKESRVDMRELLVKLTAK